MALARVGAFLVVLALVATSLAPTARSVDGPTPTVGDFWTYATNTTAATGFDLVGQVSFTVASRGPSRIGGRPVDVFNVTVSGRGNATGWLSTPLGDFPVTGDWTLAGVESLETGGLKVVSSILDLLATGTVHTDPLPQTFRLRLQNTTTFEILQDTWRFPLDVGDSGFVAARYNSTEDVRFRLGLVDNPLSHSEGFGVQTLNYTMLARVSVRTPAGTFDAYRIRETWPDGGYELLSYASSVGNDVHREIYNATGMRLAIADLVSYRYQALEPGTFFGLTLVQWIAVGAITAAAAGSAVVFFLRRRRRKANALTQVPPPTP